MKPTPPTPASLFQRDRTPPAPEIRGLEKTAVHPALAFPMACRILTVEFRSALTSECGVATLRLELVPYAASHLRVNLHFMNVQDCQLNALPAEGLECAGFGIENVRHLERSRVNWQGGDLRGGNLHFYAEDAEIVSVVMAQG